MKHVSHSLREVVAVVNNKGGVGKTTTVQSVAAALLLSHKSLRVLVIDMDPQCNLSQLMGWFPQDGQPTVYDALEKYRPEDDEKPLLPIYKSESGIYYSPSSPLLQQADVLFTRQMQPSMVLASIFGHPLDDHTGESLQYVNDDFDYILIDCPPAMSYTTFNAMAVATGVLVPVQMEGLSVSGLGDILVQVKRMQKSINPSLAIKGILPVMVDMRGNITKGYLDFLPTHYEGDVCKTFIHRCLKINEAQSNLKDIYQYAPKCTAAQDYATLTRELFA